MKNVLSNIAQHLKDDWHLFKIVFFPLNSSHNPVWQYEVMQKWRFTDAYFDYKHKYDEALKNHYDDEKRAEVMKDREWLFKIHAMFAVQKTPDSKKTKLELQYERCQRMSIFMAFIGELALVLVAWMAITFKLMQTI